MIIKEKQSPSPTDRFGRAGYEAEKQMSFYLRRAFAERQDVFVFNDLKFKRNDETAQIDHLVLHSFGVFLIESKSVTGSISVNEQGEYARHFSNRTKGMKSPVTQVKMQGQLLQSLLTDNRNELLGKALLGMVQKGFHPERFRYLVAISDKGVIKRQASAPTELMKADAVVSAIHDFIKFQSRFIGTRTTVSFVTASNEDIDQRLPPWKKEEVTTICNFLLENDCSEKNALSAPIVSATESASRPMEQTSSRVEPSAKTQKACKACGESALEIKYGKYGYYFKCLTCDGNTPVDSSCPACKQKAKLRKAKKQFFWNCSCGFDRLYFANP